MSGGNASSRRGKQGTKKKTREARRARLNKRLAAYSAMASGVVAASTGTSAQAALIIHDLGDFNVSSPGLTFIDINGGAIVGSNAGEDVRLYNFSNASFRAGIVYAYPDAGFSFYNTNYLVGFATGTPLQIDFSLRRFEPSQSVGVIGPSYGGTGILNQTYVTGPAADMPFGAWAPGQRGALGVLFEIGNDRHAGWVDMTLNADGSFTIHRTGYNDDPIVFGAGIPPAHYPGEVGPGPGNGPGGGNNAVPEPATFGLGMLALGAVGVSALKRRREAEAAA